MAYQILDERRWDLSALLVGSELVVADQDRYISGFAWEGIHGVAVEIEGGVRNARDFDLPGLRLALLEKEGLGRV
jgi:hypothetical protein